MSSEAIHAALFALGATTAGIVTSSRKLRHIEDLQPSEFPALFQVQVQESWATSNGNLPPIGTFAVEWWLYVQSPDPNVSHSSLLNPLIDAAKAALKLPPTPSQFGKQSLGGLVESVVLNGPIQIAEGVLEDRGVARIQLAIRLPG